MSSGNKEIWKKIEDYDYAEINNLSKSSISRCCKGLQKHMLDLRGNIFKNGKLRIYQMR